MKILIVGKGYIGDRLAHFLAKDPAFEVHSINQQQCNYTNPVDYSRFLAYHTNDLGMPFNRVIVCCGYTGTNNVDDCELPENKATTWFYNVVVPEQLVTTGRLYNTDTIVVGSGCIYNGYDKVFTEQDVPNFGLYNTDSSFYSKTKHAAETVLADKCHIFRIRIPYTYIPCKKNYLNKLLNYSTTLNMKNSITSVDDFYNFIYNFLLLDKAKVIDFGIFNVVNPEPVFAEDVVKLLISNNVPGSEKVWRLVGTTGEIPIKAGRSNVVLSDEKVSELGLRLPNTLESLDRYIKLFKDELIQAASKRGEQLIIPVNECSTCQ